MKYDVHRSNFKKIFLLMCVGSGCSYSVSFRAVTLPTSPCYVLVSYFPRLVCLPVW